jgi:hypothetical protein
MAASWRLFSRSGGAAGEILGQFRLGSVPGQRNHQRLVGTEVECASAMAAAGNGATAKAAGNSYSSTCSHRARRRLYLFQGWRLSRQALFAVVLAKSYPYRMTRKKSVWRNLEE